MDWTCECGHKRTDHRVEDEGSSCIHCDCKDCLQSDESTAEIFEQCKEHVLYLIQDAIDMADQHVRELRSDLLAMSIADNLRAAGQESRAKVCGYFNANITLGS